MHGRVPERANVRVRVHARGSEEETVLAIRPFSFNEEWKTGIQERGYVLHVHV